MQMEFHASLKVLEYLSVANAPRLLGEYQWINSLLISALTLQQFPVNGLKFLEMESLGDTLQRIGGAHQAPSITR
jgi:hypothetical protein